jgi:tRNA-uridine 2-sulfurtransferase
MSTIQPLHKGKKVFVGLSGGVDSSVAATLLKKEGYDVTGVFIKAWYPDFLKCDWQSERVDAMRVSAKLDIPFMTFDFEEEYKKEVIDHMIRSYKEGLTPNPDVMCNQHIKFGSFYSKAISMGADYVATGHYARIGGVVSDEPALLKGIDAEKDQSYFLWTIRKEYLNKILFPIGELNKKTVREIASKHGLFTAEKKDSQGLCFLGKVQIKDFLKRYIEPKKGDVLNQKGEVVGYHDGAVFYTMGQRHGFEVTSKVTDEGPHFVVSKNIADNTLTVSSEPLKHEGYSVSSAKITDVNWISTAPPDEGKTYQARFRYRQPLENCRLKGERKGKNFDIVFDTPQHAVSAGQSLVVYDGDRCLGGGFLI